MQEDDLNNDAEIVDWHMPLIGLLLSLVLVSGIGWSVYSNSNKELLIASPITYANKVARQNLNKRIIEADDSDDFKAYTDKHSDNCYDNGDHDVADLCAQWRAALAAEDSARWSKASIYVSVFGTLVSALGLIFLIKSLRQTDIALEQAKIAGDRADDSDQRQLRAYLYPRIAVARISKRTSHVRCPVDIYLKNTGRTPAKLLNYECRLFITSPETYKSSIEGGAIELQTRRLWTRVERIVGPDADIMLSFKNILKLSHFDNVGEESDSFTPELSETIIDAYLSWDYMDYLGRIWGQSAQFTTDAIEWDRESRREISMRQSGAAGKIG